MPFFSSLFNLSHPPTNESQARQAIIHLRGDASKQRRVRMQKRLDYYLDKQEAYLDDELIKKFKNPDRIKLDKEFYNITRLVIDELGVIYNENPIRELQGGSDRDTEIYTKIVEDGQLNQVMQQANRFTKLFKTTMIRPVWRDERIQFDLYTPNMFDVFQDKIDTTQAIAVVWSNTIDLFNEKLLNNDDRTIDNDPWDDREVVFFYLDHSTFLTFSFSQTRSGQFAIDLIQNESNLNNVNPYGILPFVTLRDGLPIDQFFLEGGDDLINVNEVINRKTTELNYLVKMQNFAVPVRKGVDDKSGNLILDPSMTVDIPGDTDVSRNADFKYVSPDAKIDETDKFIDRKLKKVLVRYGISPERLVESGQKSSAEALQLRAFDQAKLLKRDKPFYAGFEKELFEKTRIIWNFHNPNEQISEDVVFFIDYKEVEVPTTMEDEDSHNLLMFNNGIISKSTWLMRENPDIKDEKQAEKELEKISKEKEAERGALIQDLQAQGQQVEGQQTQEQPQEEEVIEEAE